MARNDTAREIKTLKPEDFSSVLAEPLSTRLKDIIESLAIRYTTVTPEERDECIKMSVQILLSPEADKSGEHRLNKWERGWTESLLSFKESGESGLIPKYFYRDRNLVTINSYSKLKQEYIKPLEDGFDYKILSVLLEWLFEKYTADASSVYEFGCGTGHHLLRLRNFNRTATLYGLDWAESSQKIIAEMVAKSILQNVHAKKFDFFNPDDSFILDKNSVVYTVGALEQVGERHKKFISYLLKNKPRVCFHVEPIGELLDESNLVDYLTKEYYKKRNYLAGFVSHLRTLEKDGSIEIKKVQRTYLGGSLLTEYAVVAWAPVQ